MSPRQQAFVREYLTDNNATQAAIRAGYSPRTAVVQGSRLLGNANVAAAVAEGRARVARRRDRDVDDVLDELDAIGFSNLTDVVAWGPDHFRINESDDLPPPVKAAIKSVKVKRRRQVEGQGANPDVWEVEELTFTMHDKVKALELAGKHRGMWPQKAPEIHLNIPLAVRTFLATRERGQLDFAAIAIEAGLPPLEPAEDEY